MKIIKTNLVKNVGAGAITVFPFVFVSPEFAEDKETLAHEAVHYRQQKKWCIYGLGVGLIVWYLLYLLALPVGWNPFRYRWEYEAYKEGSKWTDEGIRDTLKEAPYYLWW